MKRAQMEIMGLVVVVILITLGILFMTQLALKTKPQSSIFLRKELAASSLSALLKTSVENNICADNARPQLTEVLEDCARHYPPGIGDPTLHCDGKHSCIYFSEESKILLDETIGVWKSDYELEARLIRAPGVEPDLLFDNVKSGIGCPPNKERDSSGTFPLPTVDAGLIELRLFVCD